MRTGRSRLRSTAETFASATASRDRCTWARWPRSLAPGFLQGLMAAGAPMDISIHLGAIPAEQARAGRWSGRRCASSPAQSLSLRKGRTMSPEAEIALEDVTRLRDEVQRGRERLFHASLSVRLHAGDDASLKEMTQRARAHFGATLGKLDGLSHRQREGLVSARVPLGMNTVGVWRTLDTSSVARLFPFSPPDMDTRSGTLYGIDLRACSPVVYDPFDGTHLNANTAVLARSGSGKSFSYEARRAQGPDAGRRRLRDRSRGRVRGHGARGRRPRAVPGRAGPGHEPVRYRQGRPRGAPSAHRQPEAADRGDGRRAPERGAAGVPGPLARDVLRAAARAHGGFGTSTPSWRRGTATLRCCCGRSRRAACVTC